MAAFNSILRRSSAGVISGSQFLRFSSTAGGDVVRLLESDYSVRKSSHDMKSTFFIPDGFPFDVEDTTRSLALRRMYQNETILLRVQSIQDVYHPVFTERTPSMVLSASISKGSRDMDFALHVEGDQFCIYHLGVRDSLGHLKCCENFLESRGITTSMMDFLFDHVQQTKCQSKSMDYPQLAGFDKAWEHDFPSSSVILGDNDINLWEANYIHVLGSMQPEKLCPVICNGQTAKVINLAEDEARRLGHNFVASEQILLGLIGERTGIAAKVLKKMGITLEDARAEVLEIIGRAQDHVPEEIPFTPRAKCVVDFALEEANRQGKNYIGTEHLLLGLFEESGGVPARVLENLGADPSNIRAQVMKMLGESRNKDFLGDYTIDLTKLEEGKLHLFVGSDVLAEKKVIKLLHQGRHICLIGDDKERNKATLEAVSRRLASSRMKVISLDTDLIASARRHRGDHEEIMKNGIEDIKKLGKVVLHVEELLTKSGVKGPVIAVNSLIKAIDDKEVQLITSATQFDYNNTFQHKDNLRDILPVQVRAPTTKEIVDILKVVRKQYEVHYKVIYTDAALTLAAHLSTGDFRLAVDMIDEAGYLAQFNYAKSKHTEAKELMEELEKMRTDKKKAEKKTDFEEAAKLRDWASDLSLQIAAIVKKGKEMSKPEIEGKDLTVREANVASAFEILGHRYPVKK